MPYKVAKAGVIQYTRVLAAELGPFGVNVNCIAPGLILSSRAVAQGRSDSPTKENLEAHRSGTGSNLGHLHLGTSEGFE